jgi:hypothetical protein
MGHKPVKKQAMCHSPEHLLTVAVEDGKTPDATSFPIFVLHPRRIGQ